jgi:hypothetical protein
MKHVLVLNSDDCKDIYQRNGAAEFTINLDRPLLLNGNWVCSLEEFYYFGDDLPNQVYVCCNIVEESLCPRIQLLHYIRSAKKLIVTNPYEKPLLFDTINKIQIIILDDKLQTRQISWKTYMRYFITSNDKLVDVS